MAALLLTEADVRQLLPMDMALAAVDDAFKALALDEAQNIPRSRCQTDAVMLHVFSAAAKSHGVCGLKAYTTGRQGARFYVQLFDGNTGEHLALIQADYLGQVRTGAASGVATKYLARPEAATVGLFGTGKQARTQLEAVCRVRSIKRVHVFGRDAKRRGEFSDEMSRVCGTAVVPVEKTEHAAAGMDIIITATNSRDPVLQGEWVGPGTHLNVIGSNFRGKAEVDVETIRRAGLVVVDSKDQAKLEAGDLIPAIDAGALTWADVQELGPVMLGRAPGRENAEQITLFKSLGIGIEDVIVAKRVYERARAERTGQVVDF